MFKTLAVENAVGQILAHDITEIRQGEFKGRAFKKGHRIRTEDICHLQRLGKRHIYIVEQPDDYLHENDAARMMAAAFCGPEVTWQGEPVEGKLKLHAASDGLLEVSVADLNRVNMLAEIMCATLHTHTLVRKGAIVAATRAIPLLIRKTVVESAVTIATAAGGILRVKPLKKARVALLITGNEIAEQLIEDKFEAVITHKVQELGSSLVRTAVVPDDPPVIKSHLLEFLADGVDLILTTGGMSVDPDDVTRVGIEMAGGGDMLYGSPVLPGAMFLTAYIGDVPVLGVPACGIFHKTTMLDLVLPRVLAGDRLTRSDLAAMGHGGLCMHCPECRYPMCPFGK